MYSSLWLEVGSTFFFFRLIKNQIMKIISAMSPPIPTPKKMFGSIEFNIVIPIGVPQITLSSNGAETPTFATAPEP